MCRILVYNMSGELDDFSHLFPNERLARLGAVLRGSGARSEVWDRANLCDLEAFGGAALASLGELDYSGTNAGHEGMVRAEAERILDGGFDVALLNLWHGSGFKFTMDLAQALKASRPELLLYGVGQKVDWFNDAILDLPGSALDGLLTGLGYNAAARLASEGLLTPGPNALLRETTEAVDRGKATLQVDEYPGPVYEASVYDGIGAKLPIYPVTLSNQACPNYCRFCLRPDNYGRDNRPRDVSEVFAEIRHLHEVHGVRHFRVEDSTPPAGALTALARLVVSSPLAGQVRFSGFSRVDTNQAEDFSMLREAGFLALFFGIESMDPETLTAFGKGFTPETVRATLSATHDAGIATVGSFIYPAPGQTKEQLARNLAGIEDIRDDLDSLIALPAGVYPPTEWGRNPARYKIELDDDYIAKAAIFPIKHIQPMHLWPEPPFRYDVFGKPASEVRFRDIVAAFEDFLAVVRGLGLPGMPDYYYLLADLLGRDPEEAVPEMVGLMIDRDYQGIGALFGLSLDP